MKTTGKKKVAFKFQAEPNAEVYVAGSFNNWDATKNKLQSDGSGNYSASILIPKGHHEYKFVVNGNWCVDPSCPEWSPNAHGSLNSVINVE